MYRLIFGKVNWERKYIHHRIEKNNNSTVNHHNITNTHHLFTEVNEEFHSLKPILRNIIFSLNYVFSLDIMINYVLNLIIGGRLMNLIVYIPNIHTHDHHKKLGVLLLLGEFLIFLCLTIFSLLIFNQQQLRSLLSLIFYGSSNLKTIPRKDVIILGKIWIIAIIQYYNYFLLSIMIILFVYTMIIFRQQVQLLIDFVEKGN